MDKNTLDLFNKLSDKFGSMFVKTHAENPQFQRRGYEPVDSLFKGYDLNSITNTPSPAILLDYARVKNMPEKILHIPIFTDDDQRYQYTVAVSSAYLSTHKDVVQNTVAQGGICVMTAWLTLFANLFDHDKTRSDMAAEALQYGYVLEFQEYDTLDEMVDDQDGYVTAVMEYDHFKEEEKADARYSLAKMGVIVHFMVKHITPENYRYVFPRRLTAFSNSLGLPKSLEALNWDQERADSMNRAITATFGLRRYLFRLWYTAASDLNTRRREFYRAVLGFFS